LLIKIERKLGSIEAAFTAKEVLGLFQRHSDSVSHIVCASVAERAAGIN
jgi:hypothetical protein